MLDVGQGQDIGPEPQQGRIPTLYLLHEGTGGGAHERRDIIGAAAARADINFTALDSLTCDYAVLPQLQAGDMLFNCGRGSVRLETLLWHPGVATFRTCGSDIFTNGGDTPAYCAALAHQGFPVPRTVHRLPPENDALAGIADYLGGVSLTADTTTRTGAGSLPILASVDVPNANTPTQISHTFQPARAQRASGAVTANARRRQSKDQWHRYPILRPHDRGICRGGKMSRAHGQHQQHDLDDIDAALPWIEKGRVTS